MFLIGISKANKSQKLVEFIIPLSSQIFQLKPLVDSITHTYRPTIHAYLAVIMNIMSQDHIECFRNYSELCLSRSPLIALALLRSASLY